MAALFDYVLWKSTEAQAKYDYAKAMFQKNLYYASNMPINDSGIAFDMLFTYAASKGFESVATTANKALGYINSLFNGTGQTWSGSGPTSGVLGVEPGSTSTSAVQNYYPKDGSIEFVYDPTTKTFVVGKPNGSGFTGSPHQKLVQSIGSSESTAVGGMFTRGANGEIVTNELSGHLWKNWTDEIRQQFVDVMTDYGFDIIHNGW